MSPFDTLDDARRALVRLPGALLRSTGAWDVSQVLHHVAQSVEFSLDGFPQLKPAWFRATLGRLAFAVFSARGRMAHALDAPIPGAPPIASGLPLTAAVAHVLAALDRFERHDGPLQPHFAYGALDKAAFLRAHLMHLNDHWREFTAE